MKPARQARADGDERDVESPAPFGGLARSQLLPHVREVLAVAGVAGEIPMWEIRTQNRPSTP